MRTVLITRLVLLMLHFRLVIVDPFAGRFAKRCIRLAPL
jgi:hypothetical protein